MGRFVSYARRSGAAAGGLVRHNNDGVPLPTLLHLSSAGHSELPRLAASIPTCIITVRAPAAAAGAVMPTWTGVLAALVAASRPALNRDQRPGSAGTDTSAR